MVKYQYAIADCGGTKWVNCTYEEYLKTPENQRRIIVPPKINGVNHG